jgi:hypothetical protein
VTPQAGPAAPAASSAPAAPARPHGIKPWAVEHLHDLLVAHPGLNKALAPVAGPFVKQKFNGPDKPGDVGPAPLQASTIEQARRIMAEHFHPEQGKVLIGVSGGGKETVHAFVVSGVEPDGKVKITQAIAQYSDKPEEYKGVGGWISKLLDKQLGNQPKQMKGVVVEDWSEYAARSKRNSIVLMELDADPAKAQAALKDLQKMVGKPYDKTMLGSDPATPATEQGMYCTEVSSWFINKLRPGTIKESQVAGYPVFQVADHLRAADLNGGPLKVLFNGQNRLDIKAADPFPKG